MDISHPSFWDILLLSIPMIVGIAIFGYLYWSDSRYNKGKEKSVNKQ